MKEFDRLVDIVKKLRSENGCPWDRKQTHDSLLEFFYEETNEVADAIIRNDLIHLKEELGDILLHILLHSQIASESGIFDVKEVINDISEKLIRRHPHVFGEAIANSADDVNVLWEEVKKKEKGNKFKNILDKIPNNFTPLLKAYKYQKEVKKHNFDWNDYKPVLDKIKEEIQELEEAISNNEKNEIEHEIGDIIFAIVNLSKFFDINAEVALSKCNLRFYQRFTIVEKICKMKNKEVKDFTLNELDNFWDKSKKLLKSYDFDEIIKKIDNNEIQFQ